MPLGDRPTTGKRVTQRVRALRVGDDGSVKTTRETLAGEEPLEIRVNGQPLAVTMRTPGSDFYLVAGNLLAEGLITSANDIAHLSYCGSSNESASERTYNVINATLPGVDPAVLKTRRVITTSACGICGERSIDQVRKTARIPLNVLPPVTDTATLLRLPDVLREHQRLFDSTGGLHAAGIFDAHGNVGEVNEDVGRHNAVDKVIGAALLEGFFPCSECVLQVSGRASFELVQKCRLAGIPIMAAVSAPSSLAVNLAEETGICLIGFSRGDHFTIYSHPEYVGLTPTGHSLEQP